LHQVYVHPYSFLIARLPPQRTPLNHSFDALIALLDPDIVVREDTGSGTIVEIRGAENVARRAMAVSQLGLELGLVARPVLINGAAGWVSLLDGEVYAIAALTVQNGRITTMDILLDPARLARLDLK
jgi:hypothetical protein